MLDNFNRLETILLIYITVINIISFLTMSLDKSKAKNKNSRISENTLIGLSAIGGAAGTLLAMILIKHKTSKSKFYKGVPILYIVTKIIILIIFNYIK